MKIHQLLLIVSKKPAIFSMVFVIHCAYAESVDTHPASLGTANSPENVVNLETISLKAEQSKNALKYAANQSRDYLDQTKIDRLNLSNPADLITAVNGVYTGDSRNSGAIDPNIRGIQGQGRVPVFIDGSTQSLTANRAFGGVSERYYIDPNLISELWVDKGIANRKGVNSSVGGSISIKTLQAEDIISEGQEYGFMLKTKLANNSTKERFPDYYFGSYWGDHPSYNPDKPQEKYFPFDDTSMRLQAKDGDSSILSNFGQDCQFTVASAFKKNALAGVIAYSYSQRGNYFSGKHNRSFYENIDKSEDTIYDLTKIYEPGQEVANTFNQSKSLLAKLSYTPSDEHKLEVGYRSTDIRHGEIMPYRLVAHDHLKAGFQEFWPASHIDTQNYYLSYDYTPADNQWINLNTLLWHNRADTAMHNKSNTLYQFDYQGCVRNGRNPSRDHVACYLWDDALTEYKLNSSGLNLSNSMQLMPWLNFDINYFLSFHQRDSEDQEARSSNISYNNVKQLQHDFAFNFNLMPTDRWSIDVGFKKSMATAENPSRSNKDAKVMKNSAISYSLERHFTQADLEQLQRGEDIAGAVSASAFYNYYIRPYGDWDDLKLADGSFDLDELIYARGSTTLRDTVYWRPDDKGDYHIEDNPIFNGEVTQRYKDQNIQVGSNFIVGSLYEVERMAYETKQKLNSKWNPVLATRFKLNDQHSVYAKWAKEERLPSIFEFYPQFGSLEYIGFNLRSEKATNFELGYVSNFDQYFKDAESNFKLAYFTNTTDDVIDNDRRYLRNVGRLKTKGLELQFDYDNGRFFTELNHAYLHQQDFCQYGVDADKYVSGGDEIMQNIAYYYELDQNYQFQGIGFRGERHTNLCYRGGKASSYQATMVVPKHSFNATVGMRALDNRLEMGAKARWYSKYDGFYQDNLKQSDKQETLSNAPIGWGSTWLIDFFAQYRFNDNMQVNALVTNLSNQYYIDPLSRSNMPSPGRTFSLGLKANF
ncbi:TonB-dependent receptor domain-containing protein [Acinetobacter larvae]|uniref:TonB-dependent receptor n=1 Tax=Acinetobacter larvae TaxID=1789224 RepID=A0A1B2M0A1_9GAMM|nr:TonB-dependent receptor [Acinetobacter larvae]AOA58622.1 hypothetical protein BFG52_09835 [Acinetobacter larvae]